MSSRGRIRSAVQRFGIPLALLVFALVGVSTLVAPAQPAAAAVPPGYPPPLPDPGLPDRPQQPASQTSDGKCDGGGVAGAFAGDACINFGKYKMGYDEGGTFNVGRKASGVVLGFVWNGTTWLMGVAIAVLQWALKFTIADALLKPAYFVYYTWETKVVRRLGLLPFFIFCAMFYGGVLIARGKLKRGFGEWLVTLLVVGFTATFLARPDTLLLGPNGLLGQTKQLSLNLSLLTLSKNSPQDAYQSDPAQAIKPITDGLSRALVEEPHMLLDWGRVVYDDKSCYDKYSQIIRDTSANDSDDDSYNNPTSDKARNEMKSACRNGQAVFDFNHDPSGQRIGGAFIILLGVAFVFALLMFLAIGIIVGQLGLAFLVCLAPFAFVAGALPGSGRVVLVKWGTGVLKVLAVVVATVTLLTMFLMMMNGLLTGMGGESLLMRLVMLDALVIGTWAFRRRLTTMFTRGASTLGLAAHGYAYHIGEKVADNNYRHAQGLHNYRLLAESGVIATGDQIGRDRYLAGRDASGAFRNATYGRVTNPVRNTAAGMAWQFGRQR